MHTSHNTTDFYAAYNALRCSNVLKCQLQKENNIANGSGCVGPTAGTSIKIQNTQVVWVALDSLSTNSSAIRSHKSGRVVGWLQVDDSVCVCALQLVTVCMLLALSALLSTQKLVYGLAVHSHTHTRTQETTNKGMFRERHQRLVAQVLTFIV